MAVDWWAIFTGVWGLAAGPLGFWIGRKDRQRDVIPNVRCIDFASGTGGYSGVIEIVARTSEDITVTRIKTAGGISLAGDDNAEYDDGGSIISHQRVFLPTPRVINWHIPGNSTGRYSVVVDSLQNFQIDLMVSSSARTLRDKVIRVQALQPE
jgi:hypothetical protein